MVRYKRRSILAGGILLAGSSIALGVRSLFVRPGQVGLKPSSVQISQTPFAFNPTFESQPTPDPTPQPTPDPIAEPSLSSASGQSMPVGDLPGWHQIFAEDFNADVPIGSFPGTVYARKFWVYIDGTPDTAGKAGAPSRYYPSKVLSVSNGSLNVYLHMDNGALISAAVLPYLPSNTLYGKYTVRFRAPALPDFKTAWLLWPDSEVWPRDGEIDFPEGPLASSMYAVMHHQNGTWTDYEFFPTSITYTDWHTASLEWLPGSVRFILDNQLIGTSTTRIPDTFMHWVIQTESLTGYPTTGAGGNVEIDWVVAYTPTN